jgi:hypothetical protein
MCGIQLLPFLSVWRILFKFYLSFTICFAILLGGKAVFRELWCLPVLWNRVVGDRVPKMLVVNKLQQVGALESHQRRVPIPEQSSILYVFLCAARLPQLPHRGGWRRAGGRATWAPLSALAPGPAPARHDGCAVVPVRPQPLHCSSCCYSNMWGGRLLQPMKFGMGGCVLVMSYGYWEEV